MPDPASRYAACETASFLREDGKEVRYLRRRFLPQPGAMQTLTQVRVQPGERLDLVATRTLGDPLQYWQLCDANAATRPNELVERPDAMLRVPLPRPPGA